ncbi:MAG: mechanosensitive ion channel family protein, partial [Acidimicrobiales bacterium]
VDPGSLCEWVYEETGNETLASLVEWFIGAPLQVLLILLVAFVASRLLRRAVDHFGQKLTDDQENDTLRRVRSGRAGQLLSDKELDDRAKARTETLTSVLSSTTTLIVWTIATLLVLGELGISLAPLIAGAGIAGVALGFGAQSVVGDFLSGFFILVEDQYGVGDVVDVGEVTGNVERVTLRTTVLRDLHGNVWYVPNGQIRRTGNMSQLWSRAVLDIEVAYETDLRLAEGIIQRVADDLWQDKSFDDGDIIDAPEVWGVEKLGADGVVIRLVVKTDPAEQWGVARELRLRIKEAFDIAGVEIPYPQRNVWLNEAEASADPDQADIATAPVRRRAEVDADQVPPADLSLG